MYIKKIISDFSKVKILRYKNSVKMYIIYFYIVWKISLTYLISQQTVNYIVWINKNNIDNYLYLSTTLLIKLINSEKELTSQKLPVSVYVVYCIK